MTNSTMKMMEKTSSPPEENFGRTTPRARGGGDHQHAVEGDTRHDESVEVRALNDAAEELGDVRVPVRIFHLLILMVMDRINSSFTFGGTSSVAIFA